MDLVLGIADEYLLDKAWAFIVPAHVFAAEHEGSVSQSSLTLPIALQRTLTLPTWHRLIALLPHPPLPSTYDTSVFPPLSAWPRDYIPRQLISLSLITLIGIFCLYLIFAGFSYQYIFNHDMMNHPRFLKNQVKLEIQCSLRAFPGMTLLTLPWFLAEVRGYSRLYDKVDDYGLAYLLFSIPL